MKQALQLISISVLLAACTSVPTATTCQSANVTITGNYPGANIGVCQVTSQGAFLLLNSPEDEPINHSPWYGFRLDGEAGDVEVVIRYTSHKHRYAPKVSPDGVNWRPLPLDQVSVNDDETEIRLTLHLGEAPLFVSSQENWHTGWYDHWLDRLSDSYGLNVVSAGDSMGGKPIRVFQTNPGAPGSILILGRQHPPEVTGAIALEAFIEHYLALQAQCIQEEPAACAFFDSHNLIVFPLLNPDGVDAGHWRHGLGHVDLNRDWGPFTQPETRHVRSFLISTLRENKLKLMLDFHSTTGNLFYTQPEDQTSKTPSFASRWLAKARERDVYEFSQEPRHNEGRPTAKNYFHVQHGIPSITYEVGDDTDRDAIRVSSRIFLETMMESL